MTAFQPLRPRPASGALGGALVHLDTTGSTNDHARALALAGAPAGTVVVAEEQTAGRGRQGRSWTAPRGRSLTLSVLWKLDRSFESLPLAVAVAVCEACERVAPVRCRIKWPNDVWIGERKLAGILIESRPQEQWAVIGIGLNVDADTSELEPSLRETATSLRIESGAAVGRDRALAALTDVLGQRLRELERDADPVLAEYRERDLLRGRLIAWTAGPRRLSGEAQGIDEHGNLVVFTPEGESVTLNAGEVHLEVE
jgi:BirA family transcriptional regulator, biotin operon repressor / biotin---[acetyl-CoA-carboxylase] ligase